jgi:hypothetical protein
MAGGTHRRIRVQSDGDLERHDEASSRASECKGIACGKLAWVTSTAEPPRVWGAREHREAFRRSTSEAGCSMAALLRLDLLV